jgi:hypothetical protein
MWISIDADYSLNLMINRFGHDTQLCPAEFCPAALRNGGPDRYSSCAADLDLTWRPKCDSLRFWNSDNLLQLVCGSYRPAY